MSKRTIQLSFFIGVTILFLVLSFFIFKPYLGVIFLAGVLAVSFYPLFKKLTAKFNGNKHLSALITVLIIVVCIIIPVVFLSASLLREAIDLYSKVAYGGGQEFLSKANEFVNNIESFFLSKNLDFNLNFESYVANLLDWIISHFDSLFAVIFSGIFKFFLMLLSLYYMLIYGEKIRDGIVAWSPLPDTYDNEFLNTLESSVNAVLRGRLLVSIVQGLFIGVGFSIFGISNPVIWGFVGAIASLVPILGTSVVTVPAAVYLLVSGDVIQGVGIILWSVVCVGLIDNVLSFYFFRGKIKVHPIVVLFSIIGGVEMFGTIGFLIGPVVVSALISLLRVYPFIMSEKK